MLKLEFPGITQEEFEDAFSVLDECIVRTLPCLGFTNPFMGPGGQYGSCWWERDSTLTLNGYCWLDQKFCEDALDNFTRVQKENGRIPLYGGDRVGDYDVELSAIPVIFEVVLRICKRSTDKEYIRKMYNMLVRYMDWWLSPLKRDSKTGLICGIFEETDPSDIAEQLTVAEVDLNVQVCVGADVLAEIAEYLGEEEAAVRYHALFHEFRALINKWMYNPEDGAYYSYLVKEERLQTERFYNYMFDTFKRKIVPEERIPRLLAILKDDKYFGYDSKYGITTMARTCSQYCETVGVYKGYHSWSGNIWTLRNEIIITGLRDSGCRKESAHMSYQTIMTFNGNYAEFISPSTGIGHGVERYGWSASEYIELIVEEIFGIRYNAWTDTLTVSPNIPEEIYGETISIKNVSLGNGKYVHVAIECAKNPKVAYEVTDVQAE